MLVLEEIMFGKNIFFTGSAGTGKSVSCDSFNPNYFLI
jgi:dephospho-CoA kinase